MKYSPTITGNGKQPQEVTPKKGIHTVYYNLKCQKLPFLRKIHIYSLKLDDKLYSMALFFKHFGTSSHTVYPPINPNKVGLFKGSFSEEGVNLTLIFQEELIQYQCNFTQLLNNLYR